MNKDELISRIKDTNQIDERDEHVYAKSFVYTTILTQLLCIVFIIINIISSIKDRTDTKISDLVSLIFIQFAFSKLYQFKMTKKKLDLILCIVYTIFMILAFMEYITGINPISYA